jgi:Ca2+-binding EF-hand superfamily protein
VLKTEELLAIYQQFFPFGDPTAFAELIFGQFDANKDGVIDFAEYLWSLSVASRGKLEAKVQGAFRFYDLMETASSPTPKCSLLSRAFGDAKLTSP